MLDNDHITRFGNPLSERGALYVVSDLEGLVQATIDIDIARIHSQGIVVGATTTMQIREKVELARRKYDSMIENIGIPEGIKLLISASAKRDVERLASTLTLTESELFLLVHNYSQLGFTHRSKFPDFVPDHLVISDRDRAELHGGSPSSFGRKVRSLFEFRKQNHVHLFENGIDWHCFYFSHGDIEDSGSNHWRGGPHIHYASHLWPRIVAAKLWESFDKRRGRAIGGAHIAFQPFEFPAYGSSPTSTGATTEQTFPMNPRLLQTRESTPPAQLLTRGIWSANISVPQVRLPS